MAKLMKPPALEAGVVMPDACPAGKEPGTIPVGGAVVSRAQPRLPQLWHLLLNERYIAEADG